jgi:hypothetical protein
VVEVLLPDQAGALGVEGPAVDEGSGFLDGGAHFLAARDFSTLAIVGWVLMR